MCVCVCGRCAHLCRADLEAPFIIKDTSKRKERELRDAQKRRTGTGGRIINAHKSVEERRRQKEWDRKARECMYRSHVCATNCM